MFMPPRQLLNPRQFKPYLNFYLSIGNACGRGFVRFSQGKSASFAIGLTIFSVLYMQDEVTGYLKLAHAFGKENRVR